MWRFACIKQNFSDSQFWTTDVPQTDEFNSTSPTEFAILVLLLIKNYTISFLFPQHTIGILIWHFVALLHFCPVFS